MKHSSARLSWAWMGALLLVAVGSGCAGVKSPTEGGGGQTGTQVGSGGRGAPPPTPCNGPGGLCTDFPTSPDVDPGVSTNIGGSGSGAGPCINEPQDGSLFPNNWLRPRLITKGVSGPVKITIHSDKEANDWTIYSANDPLKPWTMGKTQDEWYRMAPHLAGKPVTMTVVGTSGGPSTTTFNVAPVGASGTMVFWAANPTFADIDEHACQTSLTADCASAAELRGFAVGDETTETVLGIAQVVQPSRLDSGNPAPVTCIGCHSATPDKGFVTFADSYPWRTATASVEGPTGATATGYPYPTVSSSGLAALQQPGWGPFSFSLSKDTANNPTWQPGKRIGIGALGLVDPRVPQYDNAPDQNDSPNLAWFNLEAPPRTPMNGDAGNWAYASFDAAGAGVSSNASLGFIKHTGDICGSKPCGAGMPSFSHDGQQIVYVSTNAALSGRFNQEIPNPSPATMATQANNNIDRRGGLTNLYSVPFNDGMGGPASPIDGAATAEFEEYYPALSPDDKLVAFTRVPATQPMYANANAELFVVKTGGGGVTRLAANDPPQCSGKSSPGINNHWAKWSPDVPNVGSARYYWMIFSSNRADIPPQSSSKGRTIKMSQLYLAPVVIDETGGITSYPAIYLWNQPTTSVNTTPAWETFTIPIIP